MHNEDNESNMMRYFTKYSTQSLKESEQDLRVSPKSVHRLLQKHKFHPYSVHLVWNIVPGDLQKGAEFPEFLLRKFQEVESFLIKIVWIDEVQFTKIEYLIFMLWKKSK